MNTNTNQWAVFGEQKRGKNPKPATQPRPAEVDVPAPETVALPAVKPIAPEPVALSQVQVKQMELEQKLVGLEAMRVKLQAQHLNVEKDVLDFHIQLAETEAQIECTQTKIQLAKNRLKPADNFPKLRRSMASVERETPLTDLELREQALVVLKATHAQLQKQLAAAEEAEGAIQIQLAEIDADRVCAQKMLQIGTGAKPVGKTGVSLFDGCSSGPMTPVHGETPRTLRTSKPVAFVVMITQLAGANPIATQHRQFGRGQQYKVCFGRKTLTPNVAELLEKMANKQLLPSELSQNCIQAAKILREKTPPVVELPDRFLLHLLAVYNPIGFYTNPDTFAVTMTIYSN